MSQLTSATAPAITVASTEIRQFDGLYSLNDLHKASGGDLNKRPQQFMRNQQIQDLIAEIQNAQICAFKVRRGIGGGTYACREIVIAYGAWISPTFHLTVLRCFLERIEERRPAIHPPVWTKPRPSCQRYPGQDMSGAPHTVTTARRILTDLLTWAHEELPNPARAELVDALQDLSGLLTTGWTEVDEALAAMSHAMRYLHRWQDRGGRIGNVG